MKKRNLYQGRRGRSESRGRAICPHSELIEGGKVLALNMPAGSNPTLARAVGVMLKNAWLQALLMRPAKMKESPGVYFRPAVFICDEYQAFASGGEDDPSGDEKSFALTRQCRCIPIVATQSISSLRAVLGSSEAAEAWARPNHSGSNARPCFTRETSPCSRTVKPSVCPMTGRSRLSRAAST